MATLTNSPTVSRWLVFPPSPAALARSLTDVQQRLASVCENVLTLRGDPDVTALHVSVEGGCPALLEPTVLRAARELVGNAIEHGLRARLLGRVEVSLQSGNGRTALTVSDDGWGCGEHPAFGEGLSLAALLADRDGRRLTLVRRRGWTVATFDVPHAAVRDHKLQPAKWSWQRSLTIGRALLSSLPIVSPLLPFLPLLSILLSRFAR